MKAVLFDLLGTCPVRLEFAPVLKQFVDCAQEKLLEIELKRATERLHNAVEEEQSATLMAEHKPGGVRLIAKLIDHISNFAERERIVTRRKEIRNELERTRFAVS